MNRICAAILAMMIIASAMMGLALLLGAARAHDAHLYDPDCCGSQDCEPVAAMTFVASDLTSMPVTMVTTSLGTKPITAETKIRESKDGRTHGCIYQGKLICLYLAPGN